VRVTIGEDQGQADEVAVTDEKYLPNPSKYLLSMLFVA
jgi:hypothetical protein